MSEPRSDAPFSKRAVWGLVLVAIALPLTFLPFAWAFIQDEGPSSYEATTLTTLIAVPLGTAGLILALLGASDISQSQGELRGGRLALTAIVLGAIGAAAATPLILGALF
jgi:amino acid transporter